MLLAPSLLSADFSNLAEDVKKIDGSDLLHIDVMDGHFVPNISFGAAVMKSLIGKTDIPFDVHLMIENPEKYINDFVTPQTRYITVHQEACKHLDRVVNQIKETGALAGVSINPATPVNILDDILPSVDMVLVMSVNPGFGGQKFIPHALDKVEELAKIRDERNLDFMIEVDGGVNPDNGNELLEKGADILVAGSAVFKSPNVAETIKEFKSL